MPVHKHYGKFRARLAVGGKWKTAPQRNTEGAAEEDMRQLEAVKDQGMVAVEAVLRRLHAAEIESQRAVTIESRGASFRARLKHDQCTYRGPTRKTKLEAQADGQRLLTAAGVSAAALQDVVEELANSVAVQESSLETSISEAVGAWLQQKNTGTEQGLSAALRKRMRRADPATAQGRAFDAARKLVDAHLAVEALAADAAAGWLRELGLHFRLDSDSRPRGMAGFVQAPAYTGLRNLGNSCYVNSVIQCILSCKPLLRDMTDEPEKKGPLGRRLGEVLHQLQGQDWDCVAPFHLMHQVYLTDPGLFVPGVSADASEACALFLDKCVSDKTVCMSTASAEGPTTCACAAGQDVHFEKPHEILLAIVPSQKR